MAAAQPLRPLPDGRHGQSSSSLGGSSPYSRPYYYSNDDIKTLHTIVTLAEAILPTLPERVRLPTNALFQAAEQVLPEQGYEADYIPAHIARFIFQLGGIRSQESLYDKFEYLLGELGISLVFDESSSRDEDSPEQPFSTRPSAKMDGSPVSWHPARLSVRRRGSLPEHTDQVSLLDSPSQGMGHQVRTRSVSPHLPSHPPAPPPRRSLLSILPAGDGGDDLRLRALQDAEESIPGHPLGPSPLPRAFETEDGSSSVDHLPASPVIPEVGYNGNINGHDQHSLDDVSQEFTLNDESLDDVDPSKASLGTEDMESVATPDNMIISSRQHHAVSNKEGHADPLAHHRLPLRHTHSHMELAELEVRALTFQQRQDRGPLHSLIDMWYAKTFEKRAIDDEELEFAHRCDLLESSSQILFDWSTIATMARNERVGTDNYASWVARKERLAFRAYHLHAMVHAIEHMAAQAKDEVDRTAVARRHVLRKRLFDGWSQQHVEDQAKIKTFAVVEPINRWAQATLARQVRRAAAEHEQEVRAMRDAVNTMWSVSKARFADCMYKYRSQEDSLITWQGKKYEAENEEEVAIFCETQMPLIDAVNTWHGSLRGMIGAAADNGGEARRVYEEKEASYNDAMAMDLEARLQYVIQQRADEAKHDAVLVLQQQVHNAMGNNESADHVCLERHVCHWDLETRMKMFKETQNRRDQSEAVHILALAERECWYTKETRQEDLQENLGAWHNAMEDSRRITAQEDANTEMVSGYYRKADAIETWLETVEDQETARRNAMTVDLYRAAGPIVSHWVAKCREEFFGYPELAKNAYEELLFEEVATTTASWKCIAREKYTRNIAAIYHNARRKDKQEKAMKFIAKWQLAEGECRAMQEIARYRREAAEWEAAQRGVTDWSMFVRNADVLKEGADIAFLDVPIQDWHHLGREASINVEDALDYYQEHVYAAAVENWERKTLELDGPKHTVTKIQERNEQRTTHDTISKWHHQAVPDAPSYRTSIAARRSVRQSMRASTLAEPSVPAPEAVPTPIFDEFEDESLDATDLVASTPVRRSSALAPYRGTTTTTPSAILPSPAERELRRTYGERRVAFAGIQEEEEE